MVEIDALETLLAVLDTGSFSSAARKLGLSVNAISQRISRLEKDVGTQLFVRNTRSVRPTEAGLRAAERARRIFEEMVALATDLDSRSSQLRGTVRIGLPPDLARTLAWSHVATLLGEHPELRIELISGLRGPDLVSEGIDLAVWAGPLPEKSALVVRRLGTTEWHLVAAPTYAKEHGIPAAPSDLKSHECLLATTPPRDTHWELVDAAGRMCTVAVRGRLESDNAEILHAALRAGMGIGIRPRSEVETAVAAGELVRVLPAFRFRPREISLLAPTDRLNVPRVRAVADVVARSHGAFR